MGKIVLLAVLVVVLVLIVVKRRVDENKANHSEVVYPECESPRGNVKNITTTVYPKPKSNGCGYFIIIPIIIMWFVIAFAIAIFQAILKAM